MKLIQLTILFYLMAFASARAYQVYTAMPYVPADAADKTRLWKNIAEKSEGMNLNTSDTQAKVRNTPDTWKASIQEFGKAKHNGMVAIPRTSWNFGDNTRKGTLEERLEKQFKIEEKFGVTIRWVMLYGSQPGEDRTKEAYGYTADDIKRARDWLDKLEKKGHPRILLCWNVRNNSDNERKKCLDQNVDAILIEGSPEKWYNNNGRRQEFLKWVTNESKTRDKPLIFQVPFNKSPKDEDVYVELRKFVVWLSSKHMMDNHSMLRRDDVIFLPITYCAKPDFYPETNPSGTLYQNTLSGAALSLIEQKQMFEGRSLKSVNQTDIEDKQRTTR